MTGAAIESPRHERRGRRGFLSRGSDIRRVLEEGRRTSGNLVVAHVASREGATRAAFVCGRRVGGAVARNRGRRLLSEAWRTLSPAIEAGHDVVLVGRHGVEASTLARVVDDLRETLAGAGVSRT
jgi:ribonuclease P protein component